MAGNWYDTPDWNNYREVYNWAIYPVNGDDIPVPYNTPITALFPATVQKEYYDASGGTVILKADDPSQLKNVPYYYYAHLDQYTVAAGQHVSAGDIVGYSGGQTSGGLHPASQQYSSGPHIMIGESKSDTIPYTLGTLTPDLNPHWMLDYAKGANIPTNTTGMTTYNLSSNTCPKKGQKCTCPPGYSESTNGLGDPMCKNNSFPFNSQGCQECGVTSGGQIPDTLGAIANFFNSIQELTKWLSNPLRIVKLVFGMICIGGAIFLMANPESQIAANIAKGAGKVGLH
jgi:hypothetical protein